MQSPKALKEHLLPKMLDRVYFFGYCTSSNISAIHLFYVPFEVRHAIGDLQWSHHKYERELKKGVRKGREVYFCKLTQAYCMGALSLKLLT